MMRTQISLTEQERRVLDEAARRSGRSISSLIREAVEVVYGAGSTADEDLARMRRTFGSWQGRDVGGAEYVERLRSGSRLAEHAR